MEIEGARTTEPPGFSFHSACTSPYTTAPSSPRRSGSADVPANFFYSAPASPAPYIWEEKYGGKEAEEKAGDGEFAFDFSGHLETKSLTADELFDGGKIKPLKPPPKFLYDQRKQPLESPKSPARTIRDALSPRHRRADFDPFAAALEVARRESVRNSGEKRGRERSKKLTPTKSSRSVSPFRASDLVLDQELQQKSPRNSSFSFLHKKWRIKDLLLFRSASESRATDDEQMKKHAILRKAHLENVISSSSGGAGSTSSRRISAHDTANREVSDKRRFIPYKQTLFSCLGFHPSVTGLSKTLSPLPGRSPS